MTPPEPSSTASLADLVAAVGDRLTPSEEALARTVLADPTVVAFGTVADLARHVDVSAPTVVRFARTLGFDGYADLQDHVRSNVARSITRPSARIRAEQTEASAVRSELLGAIDHVFAHLTAERIGALTAPITAARVVYVVSGETSQAGARVFASGMSMLGRPVVELTDDAVGAQLGGVDPTDVVVVFDFHRYRRQAFDLVSFARDRGVSIVAVTDGPLSPYAAIADAWCDVSIPGVGPFDSSVPSVLVAELLVSTVASAMGGEAVAGIDRTEAAWDATATFLESGGDR